MRLLHLLRAFVVKQLKLFFGDWIGTLRVARYAAGAAVCITIAVIRSVNRSAQG